MLTLKVVEVRWLHIQKDNREIIMTSETNHFKHLSDFELNLMVAKHEMRYQPFTQYLPQRNWFGGELVESDKVEMLDDSAVYILAESGKEQKLDFCHDLERTSWLMLKSKINVNFYEDNDGGHLSTDTNWFVDFKNGDRYCRAVVIAYLLEHKLLQPE